MNLGMRRILITGASGFLGSHLAAHLAESNIVFGTVRAGSKIQNLQLDLRRLKVQTVTIGEEVKDIGEAIEFSRPDIVIHTAAASLGPESPETIREMVAANIEQPSLMLQAMRTIGVRRLVNCGSSWQSCDGISYSPFNFYAASKQAFEDVVDHFVADGMHCVTFRIFDTYGPGDQRAKILNLLIRTIREGQSIDMTPGEQHIDLVHVSDACRAFEQAVRRLDDVPAVGRHERFALSSGRPIPLRDLAALVERNIGRKALIKWGGRKYRDREIMQPLCPFEPLPGWNPSQKLEEALEELCRPGTYRLTQATGE